MTQMNEISEYEVKLRNWWDALSDDQKFAVYAHMQNECEIKQDMIYDIAKHLLGHTFEIHNLASQEAINLMIINSIKEKYPKRIFKKCLQKLKIYEIRKRV